jgi:hypothetical protein
MMIASAVVHVNQSALCPVFQQVTAYMLLMQMLAQSAVHAQMFVL